LQGTHRYFGVMADNLIGDSMALSEPRRDPENAEREMLQRYAIHPGERVIDIGCGDGRLTRFYARDASFVIGTDIEMDQLRIARLADPEAVSAKVNYAAARGEAMPIVNDTFDLAIFSWSF
jgi:ubiquinone/menaquinone biosynthesis C-methylase UbiE